MTNSLTIQYERSCCEYQHTSARTASPCLPRIIDQHILSIETLNRGFAIQTEKIT